MEIEQFFYKYAEIVLYPLAIIHCLLPWINFINLCSVKILGISGW